MPEARRNDIDAIVEKTVLLDNPGLYLTRYLPNYTAVKTDGSREMTAQTSHLKQIADATVPDGYELALNRWKSHLTRLDGVVAQGTFIAKWRVVIGIGGESVLENGMTLNRNWGMPLIPGSALKGLASHYLAQVLSGGDAGLQPAVLPPGANADDPIPLNQYGVLFGSTSDAAYVNWLDAWYDPMHAQGVKPFVLDVLTPHHPEYYGSRGAEEKNPPWDFDDPNPVSFLAAQGVFHIAIQAPDQAIADFAFAVLAQALEHAGIGAKTAADYGHGSLTRLESQILVTGNPGVNDVVEVANPAVDARRAINEIDAFIEEIATASKDHLQNTYAHPWCMRWAAIEDPDIRLQIALAIHRRWQEKSSVLVKMKSKGWAQDLLAMVSAHTAKGGAE